MHLYVGGHLVHIRRDVVVGCDIFQLLKPEQRHFCQNFALARDTLQRASKPSGRHLTPQDVLEEEGGRSGIRYSR